MNRREMVEAGQKAKRELGAIRSKVKKVNRLISLCNRNAKDVLKANKRNEKIFKRYDRFVFLPFLAPKLEMTTDVTFFNLYKKAYAYKTNRYALDCMCDDIKQGYDSVQEILTLCNDKRASAIKREAAIFGYKVDSALEMIDSRIHHVDDFLENVDISQND